MNCQSIRDLLICYIGSRLHADQRRAVEAHLERCQACAGELAGLRFTTGALRSLSPIEAPPGSAQQMRARVKEELARRATLSQAPEPNPAPRRGRMADLWGRVRAWEWAGAAAAFLLICAIGLAVGLPLYLKAAPR